MKIYHAIIYAVIAASCGKSSSIPTKGPELKNKRLIGSVRLYNETDKRVADDSMIITINGTALTTMSDTLGKFYFEDVPYGNYTVTYFKAGFGKYISDTIRHTNDADGRPTIIATKTLGSYSTTTVTKLKIEVTGDSIYFYTNISPAGNAGNGRGVRYFYSTTADISNINFTAYSPVYKISDAIGSPKISKTVFYTSGFSAGQRIYARAYGDSFISNDYTDYTTGKRVFPNINTTTDDARFFTLP